MMCVLYLLPGSGSTLTTQELIITAGWAAMGIVFAVISKIKYKDKFGR